MTMKYIIETRFPEYSKWQPIESYTNLNDALKRIAILRMWNSGEFRLAMKKD